MCYILKPFLKLILMVAFMLGAAFLFLAFFIFRLFFLFKWTHYGYVWNNGQYRSTVINGSTITKGHIEYYEEKNPYDSWLLFCKFFD